MFVGLLISTGAALAPALAGLATAEIGSDNPSFSQLNLIVAAFIAVALLYWGRATCRPTWWAGCGEFVFEHLQKMSIGFFTRNWPGVLISRITNDVDALNQLISMGP